MNRWRVLLSALLTTALVATGVTPVLAADEVGIPDPGFRACLSRALNGSPLTAENLAGLERTTVSCGQEGPIQDLTGAEYLTNLAGLDLRDQEITDLSPLSSARSLSSLNVRNNPIASLAPLTGLEDLRILDITDVAAADLDPLVGLPSLGILHLGGGRPVADFGVLSEVTRPLSVTFTDSSLTSTSPLALPPNTRNLTLNTPALTSLAGLERLTSLSRLSVWEAAVSDLAPLAGLSTLIQLDLYYNEVSDLTPLRELTSLQTLNLRFNKVRDLRPLSGLTELTSLNLNDNAVSDLTPLAGLTKLERLSLSHNEIRDISALADMSRLTDLNLAWNRVSEVTSLAGLPDGVDLDLTSNQIADFSPLAQWTGALEARSQRIQLPPATAETPYRIPFRLADAQGKPLSWRDTSSATYENGHLRYPQPSYQPAEGWSYFWDADDYDDTTITVTLTQEVRPAKTFTTSRPVFTSTPVVGRRITLSTPTWSPAPERLSYQWARANGGLIHGATDASYVPTAADVGDWLIVYITARKVGYATTEVVSHYSEVVQGAALTRTPAPSIRYSGKLATDTVLTAKPWTWDSGVTLKYQWQNAAQNIPGATSPTYKVKASDVGRLIRVRVTGSKPGFASVTKFSKNVTPAKAKFANKAPTITGSRTVGSKLTAKTTWPSGTKLKYQWYRNGKAIRKATGSSYTLRTGDLGDRFKVKVTASKSGYTKLTRTSASTRKVVRGTLTTAKVWIGGTAAPGRTMTAYRGIWGPGKVSYAYQWYRDGKPIRKATSKTYKVAKADAGHTLTVRVTGTKKGYTTIRKTAAGVAVTS